MCIRDSDGALTVFLLHGDMAVDDVAGAGQAKLRQNAAADGFLIIPCIIGVFLFGVGAFILYIQPVSYTHLPALGLNVRTYMGQLLAGLKNYAEDFSPAENESLMLVGNAGLGKTHAALARCV